MPIENLRISEPDWSQLRHFAKGSFNPGAAEVGAIGLLGRCDRNGRREHLVSKILWPRPGEVKEASNRALVFEASYIRRLHMEMRKSKLAGLLFVHTHPLADRTVGFSWYDDAEEPKLVENLLEIEQSTTVVSVVLGKRSQCGRVWEEGLRPGTMSRLIVVGETLKDLPLDGSAPAAPPAPAEFFSRGKALTGAGALSMLSDMTVAVVGASGTGSLVCELLARAGCKHILLVDFDVSKDVNLNRVLYMTVADVEAQTAKIDLIKNGIEGLGLGCKVTCIRGNVLDREVLAKLRDADAIIGCVDAALPRELLCRFAFQYFRPYIDVGSEIGGDDVNGIVAINARANYVAPGRDCLQCDGIVTSRTLRHESSTKAERARVVALGYSDDLVLEAPAVMDVNMHAAAYGMMLLRHILQPVLSQPLPVTISENLVTFRTVARGTARAKNSACPICKVNPWIGYGQCGPLLGFDASVVKTLME